MNRIKQRRTQAITLVLIPPSLWEKPVRKRKEKKRWHIPVDKLPPYDSKTSSVLKCTWRRRVMDIEFRYLNALTHYFKREKKKEGQRHHEDPRFKIIIKYVVNGIVINIIKNVHNLFAILFQRNPKALKHIDLP